MPQSPLTAAASGTITPDRQVHDAAAPRTVEVATSGSTTRRYVVIAFGVALVLRVLVVLWLNLAPPAYRPHLPIFADDATVYDRLAKNLLAGRGYQIDGDFRTFTRIPPLFSVFLAGLYALCGPSVLGTGLANSVLAAVTAALLFFIVRDGFTYAVGSASPDRHAGERIGFVAALMFGVYPLEIFNTPYVLKENFSIFLTAVFVFAWVRQVTSAATSGSRAAPWAMLCGVALGLSVLSRYTHLGLAATLVGVNAWLAWRYRRVVALPARLALGTGVAALCFGLTLSPWLARNYNLFGEVMLSSQGPARSLYTANADVAEPETSGYFEGHGETRQHNAGVEAKAGGDVLRQEHLFARSALYSITSRPLHFMELLAAKAVCMWRPVWAGSAVHTWLMLGVPYIAMMLLACRGLGLYWSRFRRGTMPGHPALAPVGGVILFYVLGHLAFYGMIRERQYVEPYLMAFAAFGLCSWMAARVQSAQ